MQIFIDNYLKNVKSFISILKSLQKGQRKWILKLPSLERLNDKNINQIIQQMTLIFIFMLVHFLTI